MNEFKEALTERLGEFIEANIKAANGRPLKLTEYQKEFIRAVIKRDMRKYIFLASTRVGKTECTACLALLMAIMHDGEEVTVVAPSFKQTENLFQRIRNYILSNKMLFGFVEKKKPFRRDEMNLVNGSVIRCLSAGNPETLLGFGATVLIVDEAGSIPDHVFRTRILRMLAGRAGREEPVLILLGTPHHINFFYEAWCSDDYWKKRVTWREGVKAGILDEKEVLDAKKWMTETEFRAWFEAEFVAGEGELFNLQKIAQLSIGEMLDEPRSGYDYYAGLDVARFGTDDSAYVVVAVPAETKYEDATVEVVAYYTRSKRSLSDIIGWAENRTEKWEPKIVAIDEIGAGAGVVDMMKEKMGSLIAGVAAMGRERREVYMALVELIDSGRIVLPRDDEVKDQFRHFEVSYTSDGQLRILKKARARDDIVDAMALACYVLKTYTAESIYVADALIGKL